MDSSTSSVAASSTTPWLPLRVARSCLELDGDEVQLSSRATAAALPSNISSFAGQGPSALGPLDCAGLCDFSVFFFSVEAPPTGNVVPGEVYTSPEKLTLPVQSL